MNAFEGFAPDVCLAVPLKTGVNLHLAICGTDILLCEQRKLGVPAPRKSGGFRGRQQNNLLFLSSFLSLLELRVFFFHTPLAVQDARE